VGSSGLEGARLQGLREKLPLECFIKGGTTSQAGKKVALKRPVSGHDFSRADTLFSFPSEPPSAGGTGPAPIVSAACESVLCPAYIDCRFLLE